MTKRLFLLLGVTIFLIGCTQKTSQENSGVPAPENPSMAAASTSDATQKLPPDTMAKAEKVLSQESQDIEPADESSAVQITSSLTDSPFAPPAVTEIQTALKNLNLYEGKIDGDLGPRTKKAIKDFQEQNNLSVDGKVGPRTWAKLQPYLNQATETASLSVKE